MEPCDIDIIHQVNRGRRWGAVGDYGVCTISCSNRGFQVFHFVRPWDGIIYHPPVFTRLALASLAALERRVSLVKVL